MKLAITLTNNSSHAISSDFQIRAIGKLPLDLSHLGMGPKQSLGYCVIWSSREALDGKALEPGQKIKIDCDTYSKENFIILDVMHGAKIAGGDDMGTAFKLDIKHRDQVTFVDNDE
jgi:hypothetical protein